MNKGTILTSLSLCLALFTVGIWIIFGPLFLNDFSKIKFVSFVYFGIACVGMALWFLGFYNFRKIGFSWFATILSLTSFLLSGAVLFSATGLLFNGPAEVKGTVERVGNDFVLIDVDDNYKNEYNMDGSVITSLDGPSVQSSDLGFIVGISWRTVFIEQTGPWIWQRKKVNASNLRIGQHIQIKYNGMRYLTGSIAEAGEIIILDK